MLNVPGYDAFDLRMLSLIVRVLMLLFEYFRRIDLVITFEIRRRLEKELVLV